MEDIEPAQLRGGNRVLARYTAAAWIAVRSIGMMRLPKGRTVFKVMVVSVPGRELTARNRILLRLVES